MATESVSVVPLDRLVPGDLARVLAAQRDEWALRLDWDLTEISALITEALAGGVLSGSVLMVGDDPAGYGFYVPELQRVLLGEIYTIPEHRTAHATALLVNDLVSQVVTAFPNKRIESHSVHFDAEGLDRTFSRLGFERADRTFMRTTTRELPEAEHRRVLLRSWRDQDFDRVVDVIYQAYRGGVDARANSGYRTREGCADLLDALVNSPWCGSFDEELTHVAIDRISGRICAVAVASTISASIGHLGQISVLPIYQGEGVGRALVNRAIAAGSRRGLAAMTLAVTNDNGSAMHLYRGCGFSTTLEFPVFYWDPRTK